MRTALALFLIAVCLPLGAQSPYLVKDINATTNSIAASSSPANFIKFGSRIYFSATTAAYGRELWSTDGTQSGTTLVADVLPGASVSSNPSRFVNVNGHLLFNARDINGEELWTTDGSAAGTRLLADIASGSPSSSPGDRIVYHGQLIFAANDGVNGNEVWITDGTPAATRLLKDITPGSTGSNPHGFVVFKDIVYFAADNALWKTDGTADGTVRVKGSIRVNGLTAAAFGLFFVGGGAQTQPWISDGTEDGTHIIGQGISTELDESYATAFGDRVLFTGRDSVHGDELWISDGTASGTHLLRDVNPGVNDAVANNPYITVNGGVAFFAAADGTDGSEVWKTDGTEEGTTMVRDVLPGGFGSFPRGFIVLGSSVYFAASTTPNGTQTLWTTDGTAAGTRQINALHPAGVTIPSDTPFIPGVASSLPAFTAIDGSLYFAGFNPLNGVEPWKSDGTDSGTAMIANLTSDPVPSSSPRNLVAAGDWVYFQAWDGIGQITQEGLPWSLWRSDGTPEGTLKISDSSKVPYATIGRTLLFTKDGIWSSDGTQEGTGPATELAKRFPDGSSIYYASAQVIMATSHGTTWATTTAAGASAFPFGIFGFGPPVATVQFPNVAGRLMFAGFGISTTDGTADGTYSIVPSLGEFADSATAVLGGYLFFSTHNDTTGKLWKTEGTFDGTVVVKALPGIPGLVSAAGRNVYFTVSGQLWVSDGTEAGTHSLPATPTRGPLAAIGDSIVFAAGDAATGTELWVSDGTAAGTHLIADLYPGAFGSSPTQLTSAGSLVYFAAFDSLLGGEPWVTDGTAAGTKLVADLQPGALGSGPEDFVQAGDRLFFNATTSATGSELWALPLTTPRLTIDDVRVAEGNSGTVAARFTVSLSPAQSKSITVDYATADGTATAGSDYTAATGTLTFAPGETAKSIDVTVRGDTSPENNETFFVNLKNAAGATLLKPSGFAVIDDDDAAADIALSVAFSGHLATINASNSGPRAATNLKYTSTGTPGEQPTRGCDCSLFQLPSGTTAPAITAGWSAADQQYFTVTAMGRERDPQKSNNTVGYTTHGNLAIDALYLTPGSQANVSFGFHTPAQYSVDSSNPAVVSVPSATTVPATGTATFVARGLTTGTATIRVLSGTSVIDSLAINVVPAGTTPRWPPPITVSQDKFNLRFDEQFRVAVENLGTAPYNGAPPSGVVTVSNQGREIGRITLGPDRQISTLTLSPTGIGTQHVDVSYAGDTNFLPMTVPLTFEIAHGAVTMLASPQRSGTTVNMHVRVTGSSVATPTGTVSVAEHGALESEGTLTATAPGVAEADLKVTGVASGTHLFIVLYSGDSTYNFGKQNIPLIDGRGRAVRH
jgi:ELWxxDGT repeat protein